MRLAMSSRRPDLGIGDFARHRVERVAQSSELIATSQAAAGVEVSGCQLLGRPHQPVGAARQQEMKDDPQCCREYRHPTRPVE